MDHVSARARCPGSHPVAVMLESNHCSARSGPFVVHEVLVLDREANEYNPVCPASLFDGASSSPSCGARLPDRTVSAPQATESTPQATESASQAPEIVAGQNRMNLAGLSATEGSRNEIEEAILSAIDGVLHAPLLPGVTTSASRAVVTPQAANDQVNVTESGLTEAQVEQKPQK